MLQQQTEEFYAFKIDCITHRDIYRKSAIASILNIGTE